MLGVVQKFNKNGDFIKSILIKDDIDMIKNFADRIARMADSINRGGIKTSMSIGYAKFDAEKGRNFSNDNGTCRRNDVRKQAFVLQKLKI